ncbi:Mitochondrial distribution and morphology protein 12, partial [Dispira parvispora]
MTQYPDFDDPSYASVTSSHDEETDYDADDDNDLDEIPPAPSSHAATVTPSLTRSPAFRPTWLVTNQARLLASPSKRKPVPTPPTPSLDSVAGLVTSRTRSTSTSMSTGSHGPGSLLHHTEPSSPRFGTSSFHKALLANGGGEYGHNLFNRTQRSWQTSQIRPAVAHVNQELNAGSIRHLTLFLRQVLSRVAVTNSREWESVLVGLLLKVTGRVQIDVRAGDWLDVRHYVKIKKISGGSPQESEFVAGVVCSKNLAHRKMPQVIRKPRILILLFPLEFEADQGSGSRFVSLESVLNQERAYLESVLNRVLMYLPTLILVEKSVSSMAQEILWQKGVPFAYRVKRSTLEQVARLTGAKLIHSLDDLTGDIQLGRCGYMAIESFQHQYIPGIRKSYMYFHDCPEPLGCTLVLRGAHQDKLMTIKMVLQFMVYVAYSLKLETFLLRDLFALTPQVDPIPSPPGTTVQPAVEESSSSLDHRADLALEPYRTTLLSTSPGVRFPLPYLLVRMQQVEAPYHQVRHDYLQFLLTCKQQTHLHIPSSLLIGDATVPSLTSQEEWSNDLRLFHQYENILNEYTSDIRAGELFIQQHPRQAVDPIYHQNLYVFSATHRKGDHHPCRSPEIHMVEYYQESDISLGQYLEE